MNKRMRRYMGIPYPDSVMKAVFGSGLLSSDQLLNNCPQIHQVFFRNVAVCPRRFSDTPE